METSALPIQGCNQNVDTFGMMRAPKRLRDILERDTFPVTPQNKMVAFVTLHPYTTTPLTGMDCMGLSTSFSCNSITFCPI